MSNIGKEDWEVRGETFKRFEVVTKTYEVRDDAIPLRLQYIRDFVAQTQGYPAGAKIHIAHKAGGAPVDRIYAIQAETSNEVPVFDAAQ